MNETRVVEIARQFLQKIRPAGPDNFIALCPFHDDTSPSFCMSIHSGLYICYACAEKGTFRSFLTKLGATPQDLKFKYGKTLEDLRRNQPPPPNPLKPEVVMEPNRHIPEDLLGVFNRCPLGLLEEGFDEAILKEFGVGVDVTHDRVTYPLRDLQGHLVGISGRSLHDDVEPRYKVYLEEYRKWDLPPYQTDKRLLLWNAYRIYPEVMRASDRPRVVIVEGFKACMWLKQAGIKYVVALMTREMSRAQKWILERMGGSYVLMLDNDAPGITGTINVAAELLKSAPVRVVEYDGRQPTDVPLHELPGLVESAASYDDIALS